MAETVTIAQLLAEIIFEEDLRGLEKAERHLGRMGRKLLLFGAAVSGAGIAVAKAAIDWESDFTGVRKTVDATEAQFRALEAGLRELARTTPVNHSTIATIAELGGQLNVASDDLLDFTRVIAMLADTTDLTAESAATSLARIANITNLPAEDLLRLGNTIVDVGNNAAATESEIVTLLLRIGATGKLAGLSVPEMVGFSAGLRSVGVEAEVGGTSFNRLLKAIVDASVKGGDELEAFAETAGMSVDDFREAFDEDASATLLRFLRGLGDLDKTSAIQMLDELGLTGERVGQVLLTAAGGVETVASAVETGNRGWEENSALLREAEQRWGTMASRVLTVRSRFYDAAITVGKMMIPTLERLMDHVDNMIESFADSDPEVKRFVANALFAGPVMLGLGVVLIGLAKAVAGFRLALSLIDLPLLATRFGVARIAAADFLGAFGAGKVGMAFRLGLAKEAVLGLATALGPLGVVAAVGAAVVALVLLVKHWDDVRDAVGGALRKLRDYFDLETQRERMQKELDQRELASATREVEQLQELRALGVAVDDAELAAAEQRLANLQAGLDADAAASTAERNRRIVEAGEARLAELRARRAAIEGEEYEGERFSPGLVSAEEIAYARQSPEQRRQEFELGRQERLQDLRDEEIDVVEDLQQAREELGALQVPALDQPPVVVAGAGGGSRNVDRSTNVEIAEGAIVVQGAEDPEATAAAVRDEILNQFEDATEDARQPGF